MKLLKRVIDAGICAINNGAKDEQDAVEKIYKAMLYEQSVIEKEEADATIKKAIESRKYLNIIDHPLPKKRKDQLNIDVKLKSRSILVACFFNEGGLYWRLDEYQDELFIASDEITHWRYSNK